MPISSACTGSQNTDTHMQRKKMMKKKGELINVLLDILILLLCDFENSLAVLLDWFYEQRQCADEIIKESGIYSQHNFW